MQSVLMAVKRVADQLNISSARLSERGESKQIFTSCQLFHPAFSLHSILQFSWRPIHHVSHSVTFGFRLGRGFFFFSTLSCARMVAVSCAEHYAPPPCPRTTLLAFPMPPPSFPRLPVFPHNIYLLYTASEHARCFFCRRVAFPGVRSQASLLVGTAN